MVANLTPRVPSSQELNYNDALPPKVQERDAAAISICFRTDMDQE